MHMRLGDDIPDFTAETTHGVISFYEWLGESWAVLFSHPKDFTFFCTNEPAMIAQLKDEFAARDTKVIGVNVAPHARGYMRGDVLEAFPVIADPERKVSRLYGMMHPAAGDSAPVRTVFIVGPNKKLNLIHAYPRSKGRSFDEILRVIDLLQVATDSSPRWRRSAGWSTSVTEWRAMSSAGGSP